MIANVFYFGMVGLLCFILANGISPFRYLRDDDYWSKYPLAHTEYRWFPWFLFAIAMFLAFSNHDNSRRAGEACRTLATIADTENVFYRFDVEVPSHCRVY